MQIKSVHIGRLTTKNNVFIAPLAGFSDRAFRHICLELGAGLTTTEMVSAKGLRYNNQATKELLKRSKLENPSCVQIFGSSPEIMRWACESSELEDFSIIDINMGCPVPKVFNNGEGSALLADIRLAGEIVNQCVKSGKIITVKMRAGINDGDRSAIELSRVVEDNGASMITVHGRTRDGYYAGEMDYDLIETIKKNAKIPVIANGGIFTKTDADFIIERTGADGVMLARGALFNPFLICEILGENDKIYSKKELIKRHISLLLEDMQEDRAVPYMRKQLSYYLHKVKGARSAKAEIFSAVSFNEIFNIIDRLDFDT